MNPKLLVISYWFPPFQAMGTQRVASFVRGFTAAGWQVGVIAPHDSKWAHDGLRSIAVPDCELCRAPGASWAVVLRRLSLGKLKGGAQTTGGQTASGGWLKRSLYALYNNWLCYPDECRPWIWFGTRQALRFAREFKPDLILSSAMPASSHVVAARIQHELTVPWIADYRDIWTRHKTRPRPPRQERRFQRLEDETIRNASALTTVSREYARVLEANTGKPCKVVYNGFEPADLPAQTAKPYTQFTIAYTGMIYPDEQQIETFLQGFKRFVESRHPTPSKTRFLYMGASNFFVKHSVSNIGLEAFCEVRPQQTRAEALNSQYAANVLLFLPCQTPGILTGKLFEYLATGKPILSVGTKDKEVGELLELCNRSTNCLNTDMVARVIESYWNSWRIQGSQGECCSMHIRNLTRQAQVQKMIKLAENLLP